MSLDSPVLYTIEELAQMFKISRSHAYRLKQQQKWPHHMFGTQIRFSVDDIKAIQEMNRKTPAVPAPAKRPRIPKRNS